MRDGTIKPEDVKVAGIESEEEKNLAEVHNLLSCLHDCEVGAKDPFFLPLHSALVIHTFVSVIATTHYSVPSLR